MSIIKPPRLKKGDVIGLVAPASTPAPNEKIEKGVRYLEQLGYRVRLGKHVTEVLGYLAGTDDQRLSDLNEMFRDKNVKAIFALRGGYGTPRLLSRVDYASARRNPKIIVGYSDLTALQLALFKKIGLVTFSGPMVAVEMWNSIDPYTEEHFWRVLSSAKRIGALPNPENEPVRPMIPGKAEGKLIGGNFSVMASLMGTPYHPNFAKTLLVLEDVDEAPHRVDRMFAQLQNAGVLGKISGLILGKFTDCVPSDPSKPHLTVEQVLQDVSQRVKCPVISNFQYGHIPKKLTVPLGLRARMDSSKGLVVVEEAGVE